MPKSTFNDRCSFNHYYSNRIDHTTIDIEGEEVLVDTQFIPIINRFKWNIKYESNNKYVIAVVYWGGKRTSFYLHRLISGLKAGHIDHVNGNALDNRLCNLRLSSPGDNARNRKLLTRKSLEYRGVYKSKGKFRAKVNHMDKLFYTDFFDTAIEAARAYDLLSIKHYGEFGRLNFPNEHNIKINTLDQEV